MALYLFSPTPKTIPFRFNKTDAQNNSLDSRELPNTNNFKVEPIEYTSDNGLEKIMVIWAGLSCQTIEVISQKLGVPIKFILYYIWILNSPIYTKGYIGIITDGFYGIHFCSLNGIAYELTHIFQSLKELIGEVPFVLLPHSLYRIEFQTIRREEYQSDILRCLKALSLMKSTIALLPDNILLNKKHPIGMLRSVKRTENTRLAFH